jgi:hypothetical protein
MRMKVRPNTRQTNSDDLHIVGDQDNESVWNLSLRLK